MKFGERLKELRRSNRLNTVQLAEQLQVSKQTVSNLEQGRGLPSIKLLEHIADLFCCSTDYLLGRNENKILNVAGLSESEITCLRITVAAFRNLKKK